jgi:iron complex transport system substrate-binding protein
MKKVIIIISLVFAALVGIALSRINTARPDGETAASGHPDKACYTDLVGRTVCVSRDIRRIVLPRSKDIYLLAALLGDELPDKLIAWGPDIAKHDKGIHRHLVNRFPALLQIPVTGSVYSDALDAEQMVHLQPDLIILDKFMLDRGYKYTARLEAAGQPVIYLDGSNDPFTGPQRGLMLLGQILGKTDRARRITAYVDNQIDQVLATIDARNLSRPRVYLEQGSSGPGQYAASYGRLSASGSHTSWGTILNRLRVINIADGVVDRQAPINPEYVLKSDPDIIVITGQNWTSPGAMQLGYDVRPEQARRLLGGFSNRPGWRNLSAVRNNRMFAVFHNTSAITAFAGIQALGKYCYPDQFSDMDPEANLQEFYKRFMPIAYGGAWVCSLQSPAAPAAH